MTNGAPKDGPGMGTIPSTGMGTGTTPGSGTGTGTGTGHAACHHGEILQGVFLDDRGRRRAGLVTLPMAALGTRAEFVRRPGAEDVTVLPADRTKALRAATYAMAECATHCQEPLCGGELRLTGSIPVGLGMGSSSSDVIAAVRAVADAFGVRLAPEAIARLAVRAERASDPLMLDGRPLLFAQREGRVLEELGAALPPAVVVGCALGGGRPVDTLALPTRGYDDEDVRAYERLRALLRRAVATADPVLLGHVATESARRGQRVLPHEEFGELAAIAGRVGAVGVQVAHSGNVAGLLFDPGAPDLRGRLRRCSQALAAAGIPATYTFTTTSRASTPHGPLPADPPDPPSHRTASPPIPPTSEEPAHGRERRESREGRDGRDGRAHRGSDRPTRPDTCRRPAHLPAL